MNEIIQKAINYIDEQGEKGNSLAKTIAQYIIDNCLNDTENAEKALDKSKTLSACAKVVTANARKQASGNTAVVEEAVVWRWVREYYGFKTDVVLQSTAKPAAVETVDILDFM